MNGIVHFEIPVDDRKRAENFYNKAFGWTMNRMPDFDYTMVGTTESNEEGRPKDPGAINGGMGKRGGPLEHIVVTVNVDDIDSALKKIEQLGGKTVQGKMPVGEMGFTGYFKDTEGNIVGLFAPAGM
jgi:uncharacterized protein